MKAKKSKLPEATARKIHKVVKSMKGIKIVIDPPIATYRQGKIVLVPDKDFEVAPPPNLGQWMRGKVKREGYGHRKYRPGPVIKTFDVLADAAKRGTWVFHGEKVYPAGWICNWQMRAIQHRFEAGQLRMAIRNKNVPLKFRALAVAEIDEHYWWITCDECPPLEVEVYQMDMKSVMSACEVAARRRGHFGPVTVEFSDNK